MMMVLSDMSHLEQMEDNLSFLSDFNSLNETEMATAKKAQKIFASKNLIPCTDGRPKHIPIPDLFAVMNTKQTRLERDSYYNIVHTTPDRRLSTASSTENAKRPVPGISPSASS